MIVTQGYGYSHPAIITQGYGAAKAAVDQGGGGAPRRDRERIARPRQPVNTDSDDMEAIMLACEVLGVFD